MQSHNVASTFKNVMCYLGRKFLPSGHMTFIQLRVNVYATTWCCIDVDTTLYKRRVSVELISSVIVKCLWQCRKCSPWAAFYHVRQRVPWSFHNNSKRETRTDILSRLTRERSYLTPSPSYLTVTEWLRTISWEIGKLIYSSFSWYFTQYVCTRQQIYAH